PIAQWSGKGAMITDLFENISATEKVVFAERLAASTDSATAAIGSHFHAALRASSLKQAMPHFYALKELLPNFNYTNVEIIFDRPFVEFCRENNYCPQFTKQLQFNGKRNEVFVHGSLMIGVYASGINYSGQQVPPYLLAYDMNTEKMIWGIP